MSEGVPQTNLFEQHREMLPTEVLDKLVHFGEKSIKRKQKWRFEDETELPDELDDVYQALKPALNFVPNTAILKWYRATDEYQSGAYEMHTDPEEYMSYPLVLVTASGSADLTYIDENEEEQTIACEPNSVVILSPKVPHRVSPPTNEDGSRLFLFFGRSE